MDWVKEYEEETGFSAYEFGGIPKRGYVEWLEEELDLKAKAGQHETIVNVSFLNAKKQSPEYIPTCSDDRIFLIVHGGLIESAVHKEDGYFRGDVTGETIIPDGWIEFKETTGQKH